MAEPGWSPPYDDGPPYDDCVRMCFSCVTGIHPRRLRYVDPGEGHTELSFWDEWLALAAEKGFKMELKFAAHGHPISSPAVRGPWPFADDELWIAGVPSLLYRGGSHAVVMRGQDLHYDCCKVPGSRRTRRPRRINHGWKVAPLVVR